MAAAADRPCYGTWSTLPKELLESILARIDLADHARFGSVSNWWRSVAAANPAVNKPLTLVSSRDPKRLVCRLLSSLWNDSWMSAKIIGCLDGWLVLQKDGGEELFLLNTPYSGDPIPLPPLPHDNIQRNIRKVVLSSAPSSRGSCVIVLNYAYSRLYYCRLGDTSAAWTMFYRIPTLNDMIMDVMFYKNQLYATNLQGVIKVFDNRFNSKSVCSSLPRLRYYYLCDQNASGDEKLFAIRATEKECRVYDIDPRNSVCIEVKSLGDNMLFLSPICCLSLSAKDYPELRQHQLHKFNGIELTSYSLADDTVITRDNTMERYPVFSILFNYYNFEKMIHSDDTVDISSSLTCNSSVLMGQLKREKRKRP